MTNKYNDAAITIIDAIIDPFDNSCQTSEIS